MLRDRGSLATDQPAVEDAVHVVAMGTEAKEAGLVAASATAGGGVVSAVASGDGRIVSIEFKPEVVDPEDIEMLQDLAISAVNQALEKASEISQEERGKIAGGSGVPGMGFYI